jgi:hypothetical protein
MSSISIYQSVSDLNDSTLETLVTECQSIMIKGREAAVDMCINIAKQDAYLNTLPKKVKKEKVFMIINSLNVKEDAYWKYARAGRHYIANPDSRHLSMDAILKKPKQLAAPTPKPQKPDLSTELEQAKIRITRLEREVKDLKNEVDYLKEERDDVRGWLDKNTRSGSTGVYEKLGRMLH